MGKLYRYMIYVTFYTLVIPFFYLEQCCHPASTISLLKPWKFRSFRYKPIPHSSSRLFILK